MMRITENISNTFADFLNTSECRESCDPNLHSRLVVVGGTITRLNDLVRWARERYPNHYGADTRKPTGMPYSREAMQRLWAQYLNWSEESGIDKNTARATGKEGHISHQVSEAVASKAR